MERERELREAIANWNQERIQEFLLQREVCCIFNPLVASHMGGDWERAITTTRKVLKALLKEKTLDEEGLPTLICEVEAIINSRPQTKAYDDPKDMEPITPNHLLLLRAGPEVPPELFKERTHMFEDGGSRSNTFPMCSGDVGRGNTYPSCKKGRNGSYFAGI